MKKLFLIIYATSLFSSIFAEEVSKKYQAYLQHLPSKTKKYRFFKLVLPPIKKVDKELHTLYLQTLSDLQTHTHQKRIEHLMRRYKATDPLDLLKRIKPHPISITLAQAAIESAWGTSRFFVEANNIFGVWTKSRSKTNTIQAAELRDGKRAIYLKRYNTFEESVRDYYKNIATNNAYRCFREARYYSEDPFEIVALLHKYSEKKELYPVELVKIINHNHLTKFDRKDTLPHFQEFMEMENKEED